MMMRLLFVLWLSCMAGISGSLNAQEPLYDTANKAYADKNYDAAITAYEQIINDGYASPKVYYNLGNAYFKKGSLASAILYYEKAKKLSPKDEDVLVNLKLANLKVADKIEPLPTLPLQRFWNSLVSAKNSHQWAIWLLVALWSAFAAAIIFVLGKTAAIKRLTFALGVLGLCAVILLLVFAQTQYHKELNSQFAIVFAQSAYVKSAPDMSSTDLFVLHEGIKIEMLDQVGDWQKIRLADGKVGWIEKSVFKEI